MISFSQKLSGTSEWNLIGSSSWYQKTIRNYGMKQKITEVKEMSLKLPSK